jgi:hypothetical protein
MEKQRQTEEGVKEKPNIIERLQHGRGFYLLKDCCTYYFNSERIDRETYRELRKELYDYLEKNCEMVDRGTFYFNDEEEVVVELYNCPVGKVSVFGRGSFSSNVVYEYEVSVGDKAWHLAKDLAYEVLKDWRDYAEVEPYYYINPDEIEQDIRKLMSMPE